MILHNIKDSRRKIFLLMIFALCSESFAQKFVWCSSYKQDDKWEKYALSPIEKKALKIVKKDKLKALPDVLDEIKSQGITLGSKEFFHTYFDIDVEIRDKPCSQGLSMLEWAVEFNSYKIAQGLVDSGASLNYGRTGSFASALHSNALYSLPRTRF